MELSSQEKQRMSRLSQDDQLKLKAIMQMMAKEKDAIEKDARKSKGMMEDRPTDRENPKGIGQLYIQPAVVDEIGFHIDAYKEGTINVDDMIQAIEEILYGRVKAPGQRFEEQQKTQLNTVENLIIRHLKGIYSNAYPDDFYQSFADQLMNNAEAGLVDLDGLDVESEFDNFAADNRDSVSLREMLD
jgi:hypothetical protein